MLEARPNHHQELLQRQVAAPRGIDRGSMDVGHSMTSTVLFTGLRLTLYTGSSLPLRIMRLARYGLDLQRRSTLFL